METLHLTVILQISISGTFTYYHQISVGRTPALTNQEGADIVNNIIQYENQSSIPSKWFKNFIMITGGQTIQEQIQFASQSEYFLNTYIKPPPNSGYPVRIFRNDSTSGVTFNYQDSIKNAINTGGMIVNYIGHAGSNTWDNGLDDPNVLSNQYRMPVIFSMTCFTGKNAETQFRSFGEKFINMPNKGAIGFIRFYRLEFFRFRKYFQRASDKKFYKRYYKTYR